MNRLNEITSLKTIIMSADRETLSTLLENAQVDTGYLGGRKIRIEGYRGKCTFSEVAARIENLYLATMKPIQIRQKLYEKQSQADFRPRSLITLFLGLPIKLIADAVCWATTPYPEINQEEEKGATAALEWRKA